MGPGSLGTGYAEVTGSGLALGSPRFWKEFADSGDPVGGRIWWTMAAWHSWAVQPGGASLSPARIAGGSLGALCGGGRPPPGVRVNLPPVAHSSSVICALTLRAALLAAKQGPSGSVVGAGPLPEHWPGSNFEKSLRLSGARRQGWCQPGRGRGGQCGDSGLQITCTRECVGTLVCTGRPDMRHQHVGVCILPGGRALSEA